MRFGLRELIFLVVLLAMPTAAYFFVFEPRNTQIAAAREEIRKKQGKLRQLDDETRRFDDLGREIERLTTAVDSIEQRLPAEREVDVILKEVWKTAARHRLVPKSVRTDKPVATAGCSELPIKMLLVGDFDGFYSFMLDIEKLSRITRVNRMQLKRAVGDEGQMQAEVLMSIFFDSSDAAAAGKGRS